MTYNTERRTRILEFMKENADKSFTIEEICSGILHGEGGKSTVYRQVSSLYNEGLLRRISGEGARAPSYQYLDKSAHCDSHLHLKCKECGKLIHLDGELSCALERRILKTEGFTLDGGALLYGRCEGCVHGNREVTK